MLYYFISHASVSFVNLINLNSINILKENEITLLCYRNSEIIFNFSYICN